MDLSFMCKTQNANSIPVDTFRFCERIGADPDMNQLFIDSSRSIRIIVCDARCHTCKYLRCILRVTARFIRSILHGVKWMSEATKKHKSHMLDFTFIRISNHKRKENQNQCTNSFQSRCPRQVSVWWTMNITVFASHSKHVHIRTHAYKADTRVAIFPPLFLSPSSLNISFFEYLSWNKEPFNVYILHGPISDLRCCPSSHGYR